MKVFDFSRVGKVVVNKWLTRLMSPACYTIIYGIRGSLSMFELRIPEGYSFKRDNDFVRLSAVSDAEKRKLDDFNILNSYLKENRSNLKKRWELNSVEYVQLLIGLKQCAIKTCSCISPVKKVFLNVGTLGDLRYLFKGGKK